MTSEKPTLPSGRTIQETMAGVSPLFENTFFGLGEDTLADLEQMGTRRTYTPGHILCKQGEPGDRFFVVLDGRVALTQRMHDGDEIPIGTVGPGKYFGEMSLLDDSPRTATCTTLVETILLELTKSDFNFIVKNSPSIAFSLIYRMMTNLRENNARAIDALLSQNQELERAYAELNKTQDELLRHERYKRDLEIAGEVQRSLLPTDLPNFDQFEFAAYLGGTHAGGDFYDVFSLNEEYTGILMGDVADQGVQAALLMAVTRTLFLNESKRSYSPLEVTASVNRELLDLSTRNDLFVMGFYGILHLPTGMLSYIVAGHQRPVLARPGKGLGQLPGRGSYLGQSPTMHLEERRIRLLAGDRLILYSNGVVDSLNHAGEPFGYHRLQKLIEDNIDKRAEEIVMILSQEIWIWQANNNQETDFALLVGAVS